MNNMVYKIRYSEEFKYHYLEPFCLKFTLPEKIYGNCNRLANRVWNSYVLDNQTVGVILIGDKGGGKTLTGNILSNIAIDNGLPVIMVSEVEVDQKLIEYLTKLSNCVLYLDEFGKLFRYNVQNLMLTMLSDLINTNKIIILTENDIGSINHFIVDRPGRIKYRFNFKKLKLGVIEEYCNDNGCSEELFNEIKARYNKASTFTFDFLKAIVKEHLRYPNDTLDDLLSVLNLSILENPRYWKVTNVKIKNSNNDEYVTIDEFSSNTTIPDTVMSRPIQESTWEFMIMCEPNKNSKLNTSSNTDSNMSSITPPIKTHIIRISHGWRNENNFTYVLNDDDIKVVNVDNYQITIKKFNE